MAEVVTISNSLSDVGRKSRRALLGVSTLGIVVVLTGLVPTSIPSIGVEFGANEQIMFVYVLMATISYWIFSFSIYAWTDFRLWSAQLLEWRLAGSVEKGGVAYSTLARYPGKMYDTESQFRERVVTEADGPLTEEEILNEIEIAKEIVSECNELQLAAQAVHLQSRLLAPAQLRAWFDYGVPLIAGPCALACLVWRYIL